MSDEVQSESNEETLSLLIHAASKQGKSTLASTAPLPMLVLDAEGSWKFIKQQGFQTGKKIRKKRWNPLTEAMPRYDGSWDIVTVSVRDWQTMQMTYQHLTQAEHDFKTIVLDSITEVQRRCKANLKGTAQMQIQDWGELLIKMDGLIRGYRDLTLIKGSPVACVVLIAETRMKDGKYRPYMQGQIEVSLPYWVDICGYLYTMYENDENNQPTKKSKVLHVGPSDMWESGERVQGALPDAILNPNISDMMQIIYE